VRGGRLGRQPRYNWLTRTDDGDANGMISTMEDESRAIRGYRAGLPLAGAAGDADAVKIDKSFIDALDRTETSAAGRRSETLPQLRSDNPAISRPCGMQVAIGAFHILFVGL
jgi:hypothetical protein